MTNNKSDRLAGTILLAVAILWLVGVFWTIPEVAGGARVGPRGFPTAMGVLLAVLSLFLIGGSLVGGDSIDEAEDRGERGSEAWALAATFGFLAVYVVLLDLLGFLLATVLSTASFMIFVLGRRSPVMVATVSLGLSVTIWLLLGKAMGVYLPRGSIVDWF